jgi:cAMP phosphodiesterase
MKGEVQPAMFHESSGMNDSGGSRAEVLRGLSPKSRTREGRGMKVKVLGPFGGQALGFHLSSFLIDDHYLLDAGAACSLTLEEQAQIDHVFLTHAHLDHICGIFFIADNIFGQRKRPIAIYGIPSVIQSIKRHMLNDNIWPDFTALPSPEFPTLTLKEITEGASHSVGDLVFMPIAVDHTVPAVGYLVKGKTGAFLYSGDTGTTEKIWSVAASTKSLRAIIAEVSFPNRLQKVADLSGHLTPQRLGEELKKAQNPSLPVFVTHMKPQFLEEIQQEIRSLGAKDIQLLEQGRTYHL